LQLISPTTFVFAPQRGVLDYLIYDSAKVLSKYGLEPNQIVDFKALKGDASDNIPGVMGIGDKTAVDLLQKYKTLDGIYDHLSELRDSLREKLTKDRDNAFFSRRLATIMRDVPIELDIENCKTHTFELEKIVRLFEELEFKSLLGKLNHFNGHYSRVRDIEDSNQDKGSSQHEDSSRNKDPNQHKDPSQNKDSNQHRNSSRHEDLNHADSGQQSLF